MIIAQLCEFTKVIGDIALQVNFVTCELYLNKAIKKKKTKQKMMCVNQTVSSMEEFFPALWRNKEQMRGD